MAAQQDLTAPAPASEEERPRNGVNYWVARLARLLRTRYNARAKAFGFTRAQSLAVSVVRYNPGASQRYIAEVLEMGEVTTGRLLCKLEAQGWIERRPDPADGRAIRVFIAPGSAEVLAALNLIAEGEERIALAGFSEQETDQFMSMLERITANVLAAPAPCAELPADDDDDR